MHKRRKSGYSQRVLDGNVETPGMSQKKRERTLGDPDEVYLHNTGFTSRGTRFFPKLPPRWERDAARAGKWGKQQEKKETADAKGNPEIGDEFVILEHYTEPDTWVGQHSDYVPLHFPKSPKRQKRNRKHGKE